MIVLLVILGVVLLGGVFFYNTIIKSKIAAEGAWSDIAVQLKRRFDLIPNLIETVKGYAKHEKSVFEEVTAARAATVNAEGPKEQAKAENMLEGALKSLFAVSEAYPDLKANENFKHLQEELVDAEDKIQAARRFYNASAGEYNIKIAQFPAVIFAAMFSFKPKEFFEVDEAEREAVNKPTDVKF